MVGCFAGGCGASPTPSGLEPGASGAALAGRVEITVISDVSGAAVAGAVVRARSIETGEVIAEGSTDAAGLVSLAAAALTGSISVEAASPTSAQVFVGVRTDELVMALPAAAPARASVTGNVRGLPATTSMVEVGVATDVSLLRTPSLDRAATDVCTREGDGCTFALPRAAGPDAVAIATAVDEAGEVVGFVVGTLGAGGGTLATPVAAEDLVLTLPSASGLTGIVGVPGVADDGALTLLTQPQTSAARLRVPTLSGALASAAYWLVVEAHPFTGAGMLDAAARTVLFARGVHGSAELPTWSAWLPAPTAAMDATASVTLDAVPGADVHVIDWLDTSGNVRASAWVLDDTLVGLDNLLPSGLAAREVAGVRVRAIDTTSPPSAAGWSASALEVGVERFSERLLTR